MAAKVQKVFLNYHLLFVFLLSNSYLCAMTTLIIGLLIPLLGTMLGSAFVFFMKDQMSLRLQKTLLGFASGVMVAASVPSTHKKKLQ